MSTGYQIKEQGELHYLTFQVVNWVDLFTRAVYRDIVVDSFKYAIDHKGLQLFAYVVMSNHVHLVAQSSSGDLSGINVGTSGRLRQMGGNFQLRRLHVCRFHLQNK